MDVQITLATAIFWFICVAIPIGVFLSCCCASTLICCYGCCCRKAKAKEQKIIYQLAPRK